MKSIVLLLLLTLSIVACNRKDQAGATGSGAGIEKEESPNDANITTPINEENEKD
jgi:hypothetical protein